MARKKKRTRGNRPSDAGAQSQHVVEKSAVTGTAAKPRAALHGSQPPKEPPSSQSFLGTPAGRFFSRLFKVFSSLQLALTLLTLFTLSLIKATMLESAHNMAISHELVYRTWWFFGLLLLLATNILCAALSRADPKKFFSEDLLISAGILIFFVGGSAAIGAGLFYALMSLDFVSSNLEIVKRDVLFRWGAIAGMGTAVFVGLVKTGALERLFALMREHWPWKRYQTGFLVTHLGLITLVFGGLLTVVSGEEGQVVLVDGEVVVPNPDVRNGNRFVRLPAGIGTSDDRFVLGDSHNVDIFELAATEKPETIQAIVKGKLPSDFTDEEKSGLRRRKTFLFDHGAFPWHNDKDFATNMSWDLKLLRTAARPTRKVTQSFGDNATLAITNYWPLTELLPVKPYDKEDDKLQDPFSAVQLKIRSRLFPQLARAWVTSIITHVPAGMEAQTRAIVLHRRRELENLRSVPPLQRVLQLELFSIAEPQLLQEFLNPPDFISRTPNKTIGKQGQLVLWVDNQGPFRIPIDPGRLPKDVPLGNLGIRLSVKSQGNLAEESTIKIEDREFRLADALDHLGKEFGQNRRDTNFPIVRFELKREANGATSEHVACARIPNFPSGGILQPAVADVKAMYHYPDGFWGRTDFKGGIQFARHQDKLYYRVIDSCGYYVGKGTEAITNGVTEHKLPYRDAIRSSFDVLDFLPEAVEGQKVQPRNQARIGAESPASIFGEAIWEPAFAGVLRVGGKEHPFLIRQSGTSGRVMHVSDGGSKRVFYLRMRPEYRPLPFKVQLRRTYATTDPGSTRPAEYRSEITITDSDKKKSDHSLYMNHTVDKDGYRLFQANFRDTIGTYPNYSPMHPHYAQFRDKAGKPLVTDEEGRYVNLSGIQVADDPGLSFKYAGTFTVVLGIFLMFYMKAYFFKARAKRAVERAIADA